MFQMVKFSITAKQIPGQAPRKPNRPRAKPFMFMWKTMSRLHGRCLSHEAASPSVYSCLPHSRYLFSLLPSQRAATPWGTHIVSRASWEGRCHILSRPTPSSGTGPRRTGEPGILSTWLCKLTDGVGLGTGERR